MSSGFVSAGTIIPPSSNTEPAASSPSTTSSAAALQPSALPPAADDGRSLYEILQANKAKKQEAFEASIRLSNQFQPLSESDVDFLDSVVEAKKQEEAEKKRVEAEELDKFRRNRQETEVGKDLVGEAVEGGWRKRKRGLKKKSLAGLSKKIDGDDEKKEIDDAGENMENGDDRQKRVKADKEKKSNEEGKKTLATEPAKAIPQPAHKPAGGLGLVEYGSDDDTD